MMVRQPLLRLGNPLARCDYHAVAAPYLQLFRAVLGSPAGRGAAGRPSTKAAFCHGLGLILEQARLDAHAARFQAAIRSARSAFGTDHSYAAAMATAAVTVRRKRHTAGLRDLLRAAGTQAAAQCAREPGTCQSLTPCGTGTCVFASGVLTQVTTSSPEGRTRRPARHRGAPMFSPDAALPELERLIPFVIGRPVSDSDSARAVESVLSIAV
jgi:hypothetical protein